MRWYQVSKPICVAENYASWTWYVNCIQAGGFFATCLAEICVLLIANISRQIICSVAVTLSISLIAGVSSFLTLIYNWGGVCNDAFGWVFPLMFPAAFIYLLPQCTMAGCNMGRMGVMRTSSILYGNCCWEQREYIKERLDNPLISFAWNATRLLASILHFIQWCDVIDNYCTHIRRISAGITNPRW